MPNLWDNLKQRQTLGCCVVFLCLLFTQFVQPLSVAGSTMHIYVVEYFLILLFCGACLHILIKREKIQLKVLEFALLALFAVWFVALTLYRYVYAGTITGGFIVFRVLVFPIILALLLRQYQIEKKTVALAVFFFLTLINIYQIYSLFAVSHSFRQIKGLKNINVYLCFALAALPMLIGFLADYKSECRNKAVAVKAMGIFNVFAIVCFSLFSGSRIAVCLCPVIGIASYFMANKFTRKSVRVFLVMAAAIIALVASIIALNIYDAEYNFYRVTDTMFPALHLEQRIEHSGEAEDEQVPDATEDTELNEVQASANQNAADSDNMRSVLWEKSIYYIRQNPVFGRHTIDIDAEFTFEGTGEVQTIIESPHNFILEMWLALGLPGMLIYLLMIALCAFKVLLSKISVSRKANFMLVMLAIFGFSFFQPLVTCFFAVSLLLWLAMYLFIEPAKS